MNGTLLVFKPGVSKPEISRFTRAIKTDELQAAIGGGWLEIVPNFTTIKHDGKIRRCVAFCDEEGKLARGRGPLLPNEAATYRWELAQLRTPTPLLNDFLVGSIAVVFGDAEFMEAL